MNGAPTPEQKARQAIDALLVATGWHVCDVGQANIHAHKGLAIREFPLKAGYGFADYLLYVDGRAAGVIEAKKAGTTLTGVETQSAQYTQGLPDGLPAWQTPLPFAYESTGIETHFTNGLDPDPRARSVFAFHRPESLAHSLDLAVQNQAAEAAPDYVRRGPTFLARMQAMPALAEEGLWPAQVRAIKNLERSLAEDRPRSLVQMATGSGKTFTAVSLVYRLLKFAGARRVLFLVDRGNLGRQTLKEFQQYLSPYNNYHFSEEFIVQRLSCNTLDTTARVCISTIQRLYAMLRGEELDESLEEESVFGLDEVFKEPRPVEYNPAIPIETFDIVITDECHRSIYNLWRQVLEYFDAHLIGLTATPSKQTFGFFHQNLVMEYGHEQAVADGVNVNYDVYRIRTAITEKGSTIEAGYYVDKRDRETRAVRWEQLSDDFAYEPEQLDGDVVSDGQIRTIIRTFRDKLPTEIFPGRTEVPKTLIFAKDDSHAEDIVRIVRGEFGRGNDFAQKITYRTTGDTPDNLISAFRNSFNPRIAVTVDMIATGTDIKPLEVALFMRAVKSRTFFEQMKGRGVRVIQPDDLRAVTPDAVVKDRFVIVDAVGVCEQDMTDSRPMEKKPSVSFEKLLQAVALGNTEPDVLSSVAARLARMERRLPLEDQKAIAEAAGGSTLQDLAGDLVRAIDRDAHLEWAQAEHGEAEPSEEHIQAAASVLIKDAVRPLHDPKLRELLCFLKRKNEQTVDTVSQDQVIEAGFSVDATERAKNLVQSFEQFIKDHQDEITALQILYSAPYRARLRYEDIKALATAIQEPPRLWRVDAIWQAYAALEQSKVRGASAPHILTDLVSLVRFALRQRDELVPYPDVVEANFQRWLGEQAKAGTKFSDDQIKWLRMIKDHVAGNLSIEAGDFDYSPFAQEGGLGKAHQLFGEQLGPILQQLNEGLVA